jgi:membrane-associated protease RseP (regulator of RpoE activity)
MKNFLRPCGSFGFVLLLGAWAAMTPPATAQGRGIINLLQEPSKLVHSSSQGYLGVDLADVDQEKAQTLKLKEVRGAVIILIDHDAPAGKIGLKVNDVVLTLNGQTVEGAEQLRRMLREIPAGRKVSLEISRDGSVQTLAVELANRKAMEHDVWNRIGTGGDLFEAGPGMAMMGEGDSPLPGGFHMPFFGSSLNVGAMVEPLTSQMAEYLGITGGLMVRQVAHKSEADAAGLKAFDVILKVGPDAIVTLADWERALHSNQGKTVQVTVLREKKQQTLTLQVDSKRHGLLELEEIFPSGDGRMLAEIDQEMAQNAADQALAMSDQARALKDQARELSSKISSQQAEEMRKQAEAVREQAEKLRESLKGEKFKIDQEQLDQMKQQMEEFRKNFKQEEFKLDPKMMDELRQQMEQLKQRMEELKAQGFDGLV